MDPASALDQTIRLPLVASDRFPGSVGCGAVVYRKPFRCPDHFQNFYELRPALPARRIGSERAIRDSKLDEYPLLALFPADERPFPGDDFNPSQDQRGNVDGPGEIGPGEIGPGEIGPGEMGPGEIGSGEIGPWEIGSVEIGPGEIGPG